MPVAAPHLPTLNPVPSLTLDQATRDACCAALAQVFPAAPSDRIASLLTDSRLEPAPERLRVRADWVSHAVFNACRRLPECAPLTRTPLPSLLV